MKQLLQQKGWAYFAFVLVVEEEDPRRVEVDK